MQCLYNPLNLFFYRSVPKPVANGNVLHITDDKPSPDENKVGYYDLSPRGTDIDLSPQGTDYILSSGGGGGLNMNCYFRALTLSCHMSSLLLVSCDHLVLFSFLKGL